MLLTLVEKYILIGNCTNISRTRSKPSGQSFQKNCFKELNHKMYGMLLESVQHFLQMKYGEEKWQKILVDAGCKFTVFMTHQSYSDSLMRRIAESCVRVIGDGTTMDDFMNYFGRCFVQFFSNFGYDQIIKATGRYFCDFLQSVDNIHLQMRFTYPRMQSPSMYITHVDSQGVILVYRSTRTGFTQYFMGQLYQIAEEIYNIELQISVIEEGKSSSGSKNVFVKFRLDFDNVQYVESKKKNKLLLERIPLPDFYDSILLKLFPFSVIFGEDMKIMGVGEKLSLLLGNRNVLGSHVTNHLKLRRPRGIPFVWKNILYLQSVFFELEVIRFAPSAKTGQDFDSSPVGSSLALIKRRGSQGIRSILLKGQMFYIRDIQAVTFLCSPLINDLDELPNMGLYLNDLNIHGLSKEMILKGWHHCSRLELMFERAEQRSLELEKSYELLDSWKKRGDDLLYSMIPQSVAERLRSGENRLSTCEAYDNVTILFCELADFPSSSLQDAMEVVSSMNAIFTCFDSLLDLFEVYKVETVGRVYMTVSGAPERTSNHADNIANLALCLSRQVKKLQLPSEASRIRIGMHSGSVVGGVVGLKVPRYCLFGDTVNTAARMQTTSLPGKIHISDTTHKLLNPDLYQMESRGKVHIKGKGPMETYWLSNRITDACTVSEPREKSAESNLIVSTMMTRIEDQSKEP